MKKTFSTMILAAVVVLLTATFRLRRVCGDRGWEISVFSAGCLIIGGLIIVSLK